MASVVTAASSGNGRGRCWYSELRSVYCATLNMVSTAVTGYLPFAVSPLSIIASVPSKIAFAISLVSARVGRGLTIIDSSIWVAVMTGLPNRLQREIISFCSSGTRSGGISTPKSPRATIMPSACCIIDSTLRKPSSFSILAITRIWLPPACSRNRLISTMSSARWINDAAT